MQKLWVVLQLDGPEIVPLGSMDGTARWPATDVLTFISACSKAKHKVGKSDK